MDQQVDCGRRLSRPHGITRCGRVDERPRDLKMSRRGVLEQDGELQVDQTDEEEAGGGSEIGAEEDADEGGVGSESEVEMRGVGCEGEEVEGGFGVDGRLDFDEEAVEEVGGEEG